jgi:SAM-dependent methyltransferase
MPPQDSARPDFWDTRYDSGVTPWESGRTPPRLAAFVREVAAGSRVLVPACGTGHEIYLFAEAGLDVLGLDFSPPAVAAAKRNLGCFADRVIEADYFDFDAGAGFDVIVERAFLCALPPRMREAWAARTTALLRPGGRLAGYFFFDDNERGPPFGITDLDLRALLAPALVRETDEPVTDSLPVFAGKERWQTWRRSSGGS